MQESPGRHWKNVEFEYLIPGKCCFRREILAILRDNLSLRWIFLSFSFKYFSKFVKNSHIFDEICEHIPGKFSIISSLENHLRLMTISDDALGEDDVLGWSIVGVTGLELDGVLDGEPITSIKVNMMWSGKISRNSIVLIFR